jgi:hypothetical protein
VRRLTGYILVMCATFGIGLAAKRAQLLIVRKEFRPILASSDLSSSAQPSNAVKPALKFAVCIRNEDYEASLELHRIYRVIPDEEAVADGDIRVIDESGEDHLYPADWFVFIELPRVLEKSLLRAA